MLHSSGAEEVLPVKPTEATAEALRVPAVSEEVRDSMEEVIVRFRNRHLPRSARHKEQLTSMKQSCVGDYSCCGRLP
jgi:hypothetical protein